jgi:hypothetical protein
MQYTGALQLGEKKPRVFPNPGGVFLGVFPGWVYSRCIFRVYLLVVYFTRGISFIFRAVWVWGRTGPFRRAPATTPSPGEPGPSLHWRPMGRYSSGARGTTAVSLRAGAVGPPVNECLGARPGG